MAVVARDGVPRHPRSFSNGKWTPKRYAISTQKTDLLASPRIEAAIKSIETLLARNRADESIAVSTECTGAYWKNAVMAHTGFFRFRQGGKYANYARRACSSY
ncbi:hypothetical protein F441_14735 [Phytophthora nicotianae CJ01A1]|uniref:Uncharacterized protein n=2 Tax=Phytophthora nicotianae TaxID=4792 RepID=W2G9R9_PHYNI|nr:hypothetical protein L915_14485 [Phytophthora nicotianae]ETL33095.1 hypothetical protein L916_14394 [Phytophthora nicotianae]ETP09399.1 hypothetical protein F441_14735 [Phytophthora nicotianae CJ01A1]